MTMPSREFLVQQAVLNACAFQMPHTVQMYGASFALRDIIRIVGPLEFWTGGPAHGLWFVASVRAEYAKLVTRCTYADQETIDGIFSQPRAIL